jgi:hypothetical protein
LMATCKALKLIKMKALMDASNGCLHSHL